MKRSEVFFNIISLPTDALSIVISAGFALYLRIHYQEVIGPIQFDLSFGNVATLLIKLLPVLFLVFGFFGLYQQKSTRRFTDEVLKVILAMATLLGVVVFLFFFKADIFPSRFLVLSIWFLGTLAVTLGRACLSLIQYWGLAQGKGRHNCVVIVSREPQKQTVYADLTSPELGYQIVETLVNSEGVVERLEVIIKQVRPDEIIQTDTNIDLNTNWRLWQLSRKYGIGFSYLAPVYSLQPRNVEIHRINQHTLVSIKNTPLDGWGSVAKRTLDALLSLVCLVLLSPIIFLIAVAIKLDSRGRVIYAGDRGGKSGPFRFYKFRSMHSHLSTGEEYGGQNADKVRQQLWEVNDRGGKDSPFLKIKNDPRVTRVGKFMRKAKLDEIPQFWNVLKGDMSLVGPRAHMTEEVDKYKDIHPRMFSIKPGIFGVSQIEQMKNPEMSFEVEIRLNEDYIENWSLWLDIKILALSMYHLLLGKKNNEDY